MKKFFMSLILAFSVSVQAKEAPLEPTAKTKFQQELEYIGSFFDSAYAPKGWKESHLGWNLSLELSMAKAKLASAQTISEARKAVVDFIMSTADYHVGFSFYLTEMSSLPFQVKTVEGKTLIVYIDRTKLSEDNFPFAVGDEVLTFDQVPVAQILGELMKVEGANVPETDLALADLTLTRRRASRGYFQVPQGPVTLAIKRAEDDSVASIQLMWDYTPEKLANHRNQFFGKDTSKFYSRKMVSQRAMAFATDAEGNQNNYNLGMKKSFMPDFGERIWEAPADNHFDAYIFKNEQGQLIGVVRVAAYYLMSDSDADYVKAAKDFATVIAHLQKHTQALIIDQHNNPGGSVFYLYALASTLSDQALYVPKHHIGVTAADAKECLAEIEAIKAIKSDEDADKHYGDDFHGLPKTYQIAIGIRDYCQFVLKEFNSGKTFTEATYLWGVDRINPAKNPYTKPIVILVNQLDFSGGDFFPAILQDNKRVTVIGTRTAGAGGYVLEAQFPNTLGLESIGFTGSLAERVDLNPIENLGVTPDVVLPITVEDVRGGYKKYQGEILSIVNGLVK